MATIDLFPQFAYAVGSSGHWDFVGVSETAMRDGSDASYARLEQGVSAPLGWQAALICAMEPLPPAASIDAITVHMRVGDTSKTGGASGTWIGWGFNLYADESFEDLLYYFYNDLFPAYPTPSPAIGFADFAFDHGHVNDGATGLVVPGDNPDLVQRFVDGAQMLVNFAGPNTSSPYNHISFISEFHLTVDYTPLATEASQRRVYPRDDSRRVYPPSKAQQRGNRTIGGYL